MIKITDETKNKIKGELDYVMHELNLRHCRIELAKAPNKTDEQKAMCLAYEKAIREEERTVAVLESQLKILENLK